DLGTTVRQGGLDGVGEGGVALDQRGRRPGQVAQGDGGPEGLHDDLEDRGRQGRSGLGRGRCGRLDRGGRRGNSRGGRRGGGRGDRGGGVGGEVFDPGDEGAQRLVAGELLDDVVGEGAVAAEADAAGELSDDLDALDGVDGEV